MLEQLTSFILSPEYFAGAMTGLALTKVVTTVYTEAIRRIFGVDE